jgi:hypothetical protein
MVLISPPENSDVLPQFTGPQRSLGTITHVQLAEDVVNMPLDRAFGDDQAPANFPIRGAGGETLQHLTLTFTERFGHIFKIWACYIGERLDSLNSIVNFFALIHFRHYTFLYQDLLTP